MIKSQQKHTTGSSTVDIQHAFLHADQISELERLIDVRPYAEVICALFQAVHDLPVNSVLP